MQARAPHLWLEAWVRGQGCDSSRAPRRGCWAAVGQARTDRPGGSLQSGGLMGQSW